MINNRKSPIQDDYIEKYLKTGEMSKWFRSMSTLLFLCHYIFVRMLDCIPELMIYIPEGIYKYMFVTILAFILSEILVFAGNRNTKIRMLWQ